MQTFYLAGIKHAMILPVLFVMFNFRVFLLQTVLFLRFSQWIILTYMKISLKVRDIHYWLVIRQMTVKFAYQHSRAVVHVPLFQQDKAAVSLIWRPTVTRQAKSCLQTAQLLDCLPNAILSCGFHSRIKTKEKKRCLVRETVNPQILRLASEACQ